MLTRYPELEHLLNLQFQPVVNTSPKQLTRAQIDQFNERGYIDPLPLFEGEELRRLQTYMLDPANPRSELSLHNRDAGLYDIATHPRLAAYLRDLIGENVVCHMSQFINKPPKQEKAGEHHQDATFNAMDARCPIVWLAVEDADVENGCMWFVPGSHLNGVVPCDERHFVIEPQRYGVEQPCPVKAGHIVIMNDLVFHSSPANRSSDRYRPALTMTFAPAEVKPYKDAAHWAVQCSGTDVNGYWNPQPRPGGPRLFL